MVGIKGLNENYLKIHICREPRHWETAKNITQRYVEWLGIDLSFQNFQSETDRFELEYGPPKGVYIYAEISGCIAGGVGFRQLDKDICEMKRLFVFEDFRSSGIGRKLCETLLNTAGTFGYRKMRLDTLERLENANHLYKQLGFYEIPAYRHNPEPDVKYMELLLFKNEIDMENRI